MNRKEAKLMMATGFFCCAVSFLPFVFKTFETTNFSQFVLPLLFVGGIVLIFLSLAYYTEK